MRSEREVSQAIDRYADTVQRLCMIYLKNQADTEDIFQNVFLKYATSTIAFESEEHEKAWLIRVTINACKDLLRSFFRSRTVSMEEVLDQPAPPAPRHPGGAGSGAGPAPKIPECGLSALLRGVHRPRNQPDSGQERQHGLHPAEPLPPDAPGYPGR